MATSRLWTLKVALISSALLSMAVICKLSAPFILDFLTADLPLLWSSFLSWLRPPYLYLVLNGIILTIVASSKLQPSQLVREPPPESVVALSRSSILNDDEVQLASPVVPMRRSPILFGYVDDLQEKNAAKVKLLKTEGDNSSSTFSEEDGGGGAGDELVIHRYSLWTPSRKSVGDGVEYSPVSSEKPLVSSRFVHRRASRASPDAGRALRVSKPKRNETLEATWRTITEGRPMPLTRHHRKSDTGGNAAQGRRDQAMVVGPQNSSFTSPVHIMRKSETFAEQRSAGGDSNSSAVLSPSPGCGGGSGKLRREPSLSQDELNRRVETFIRKFNEEMRLQRQPSFDQCREIISSTKAH